MLQFASITSWALWFLNIDISQGSVATYLRCGGIFIYQFVANFQWLCQWKNFENRLIFGEVMGKNLVSCFFLTHSVVHYTSWDQLLKYITGHKVKMSCNTKKGISSSKWAKTTRWWDCVSIYPPRFTGNNSLLLCDKYMPSVLWHCWLGGMKGIRPVKNRVVGYWRGYLSGVRCRLAYGPADTTATHCLLLQ